MGFDPNGGQGGGAWPPAPGQPANPWGAPQPGMPPQPGPYGAPPGYPPAAPYAPPTPYGMPGMPGQQPVQIVVQQMGMPVPVPTRSKGTALALAIVPAFFGLFGIHRFYTGHTGIGVAQLLTAGGCGIWQLIDIISLATGSYTDEKGAQLL